MARPRIQQFADDMGISYDEARKLINRGRGRTDGGSQTVERHMNKTKKMMKPTPKPAFVPGTGKATRKEPRVDLEALRSESEINELRAMMDQRKRSPYDPKDLKRMESQPVGRMYGGMQEVKAADGKYMSCRGAGKAIQGTKFSGVK